MSIVIPFGFPRLPAKPNHHSFLRLRRLREAKSPFVFTSPDTLGSKIVIRFCVSGYSVKPNRNSFLRLRTLREAKSQFILGFRRLREAKS